MRCYEFDEWPGTMDDIHSRYLAITLRAMQLIPSEVVSCTHACKVLTVACRRTFWTASTNAHFSTNFRENFRFVRVSQITTPKIFDCYCDKSSLVCSWTERIVKLNSVRSGHWIRFFWGAFLNTVVQQRGSFQHLQLDSALKNEWSRKNLTTLLWVIRQHQLGLLPIWQTHA